MIAQAVENVILWLRDCVTNTKYSPGDIITELEKLPGLVVEGPIWKEVAELDDSAVYEYYIDEQNRRYKRTWGPKYYDLIFTLTYATKKTSEMMKGVTILSAYINDQKELKCGIDPNGNPVFCGIRFENDFSSTGNSNLSSLCESQAKIKLEVVPLFSRRAAVEGVLKEKLNIDLAIQDEKADSINIERSE